MKILVAFLQNGILNFGGINMDWLIILVILAVIGFVYYLINGSNKSEKKELTKVIPIDKGNVTVKGSSLEDFDILVSVENGSFKYKVKDGNIIGVSLSGSDKYYEYME